MDFKTVGKSKSTNATVGGKAKNYKASFTNVAFQTSVAKKRGVYVEKKIHSPTDTQETKDVKIPKKPPRRSRPAQKKFLASVLTILSKSTTGTQYPEIQDNAKYNTARFRPHLKKTNESESRVIQKTIPSKKNKFRSRVLNDDMLKSNKEQLITLQPQKDIMLTPSNNSFQVKPASDLIKLTDDNEPKRNTIREILENNIYSGVAEGVTKELLDVKQKKVNKLKIIDDPETIASEIAREDKNMYNFFVDLLETTISVYDVKTATYDELREVSDVSKTAFEIDDAIARKLEIKKYTPSSDSITYTPKNKTERDTFDIRKNIPIDLKPSVDRRSPVKRKVKAKSFLYPTSVTRKATTVPAPKSKSFEVNNKNIKKPNKKEFINLIKEELQRDSNTFDEPDSLYDALKVMAKNKKRNEKSIHFVRKINNRLKNLDKDCTFDRRKVISFGSKKNNKTSRNKAPSRLDGNQKYEPDLGKSCSLSTHSIEVYGYNYEEPAKPPEVEREKQLVFNYHSSPSISESNYSDHNPIIYGLDSSGSDFFDCNR